MPDRWSDSPVRSNRQDAEDAKKTDSEKISKVLLGALGDLAVITEGSILRFSCRGDMKATTDYARSFVSS